MSRALQFLWLIPVLPLLVAGVSSLLRREQKRLSATLAIGSMVLSFIIACAAFAEVAQNPAVNRTFNFDWFQFGSASLKLGWVLNPLTAVMIVMVTFVGTLIFIYSVGYMAHDENFTRFFCFLSLFAAAMLGLVIANSLLLLFISWELVGLASYLLIGFWYHKPSAAAAAKKAFIVTRIGDIGFFLGLLWLYAKSGTLLFYDFGNGVLETGGLGKLIAQTTIGGIAVSTAISLLIFCGAAGKSGQVPLHVWLPDAMEGPTPVSALIHAATMVAAGVFLVARVYPLLDLDPANVTGSSTALTAVTWIGAITAIFAALIAVGQNDIKRILAYSTVSQLGFMMAGVGAGGPAVGMFHLITHAFFKALLFLGAGSVIHGCHDEQDIARMGGLRKWMPTTFATYAIGMMALSGVPLFFSGFWSKDEILHSASAWSVSRLPFYLLSIATVLTAFYMTRQMCYVFFGNYRGAAHPPLPFASPVAVDEHSLSPGERAGVAGTESAKLEEHSVSHESHSITPHESPRVMTWPLIILAVCSIFIGFVGTPLWPWFHFFIEGQHVHGGSLSTHVLEVMLLSTLLVAVGIGTGWWLYGRKPVETAEQPDVIQVWNADFFGLLRQRFLVDELYDASVVTGHRWAARISDLLDRFVWGGLVRAVTYVVLGLSWLDRLIDEFLINLGFDQGSESVRRSARYLSLFQNGQVQRYLRVLALSICVLAFFFLWGCRA
jgi:NADH-quinone oxidoreductase subunit L